jgi:hypothetical protein
MAKRLCKFAEVRVAGAWLFLVAAIVLQGCAATVPYRNSKTGDDQQCRVLFHENDKLTQGDGSIAKRFRSDPCWLRSVEDHLEYDLITAEFDDQGWLQDTSGLRPKPDHIDDVLTKLEQIYNENQKNGISIVLYVHGWQHNAHPEDLDVVNFRKFLTDLKAAENGRALSPSPAASSGAPRIYDVPTKGETTGPRVVGVYVGWRGESIPLRVLNLVTFWDRKNTAEHVAAGSVRELFQQLDFVRDCGRTELDWKDMRRRLSPAERFKEGKVGHRNVRMLTIGHSFGGLVTYRGLSSEFIGSAVRASEDDYVSRLGDLVFIVNPAFEGARHEPLHIAGQRIRTLKRNQLPTLIIAQTSADYATRFAFPIARALNTFWEMQPEAELDATVLAVGHNPRYRTHSLSKCTSGNECKTSCQPSAPKVKAAVKALSVDQEEVLGEAEFMEKMGHEGFQDQTTYLCSGLALAVEGKLQPSQNPFWVVHTTPDIMDSHSDIFNPMFVRFMRQMYIAVTADRLKSPATTRCTR